MLVKEKVGIMKALGKPERKFMHFSNTFMADQHSRD